MAIVAANWKMNLRRETAVALASSVAGWGGNCWLLPAFPHLLPVVQALGESRVRVGAQDVSPEPDGAYTGDVSAGMLHDLGCSLVLVGHSERRQHHGEGDDLLLRKLQAALGAGLEPLLCVGETLEQRQSGDAQGTVKRQLQVLEALEAEQRLDLCAVAYEPVWAIGTGQTATAEQAEEMQAFARSLLADLGMETVPLLYGGSVKADNVGELIAQPSVDGVLVGGASLNAESLAAICDIAEAQLG